jgi:hypothetical protein
MSSFSLSLINIFYILQYTFVYTPTLLYDMGKTGTASVPMVVAGKEEASASSEAMTVEKKKRGRPRKRAADEVADKENWISVVVGMLPEEEKKSVAQTPFVTPPSKRQILIVIDR